MSLYPSLEDMHVDRLMQSQSAMMAQYQSDLSIQQTPTFASILHGTTVQQHNASVYPALGEFMGLELSQQMIAANMPEYLTQPASSQMTTRSGVSG